MAHQDYVGVKMVAAESHLCHHLNNLNYTSFLLYICMCLIQISQVVKNVSAGVQGNTMAHVKKCSIKLQCGLLYTGNNCLHFRCTNTQHYHLHLFIHVQGMLSWYLFNFFSLHGLGLYIDAPEVIYVQ